MRVIVYCCLIVLATVVQARSYDDVIDSGFISIAVYREFPPFSWLQDDIPRGVDIELGRLIAAELGVEPRWFWLTADETLEDDLRNAIWKGQTLDASKRKADIMLRVPYDREFSYALDGYGLPRNELVHIFAPYQRERWMLARDRLKTGDAPNLAIFQYQPVGVEIDSLPDTFLGSTLGGRLRDQVVHFPTVLEALRELRSGGIAGVAGMRGQLQWGLRDRPENIRLSEDGFQALDRRHWDIGIAVKTDYRQFGYVIEAMIQEWVQDHTLEKLYGNYQLSYEKPDLYDG